MSDPAAAAQREARRRKITQNAQARMNKLLGRQDLADSGQKDLNNFTPNFSPAPNPPKEDGDQGQTEVQSIPQPKSSPYNLRRRHQKLDSTPVSLKTEEQTAMSEAFTPVAFAPEQTRYKESTSDIQPIIERPMTSHESIETSHVTHNLEPINHVSTTARLENQHMNTYDAKSLEIFRIVMCVATSFMSRSVLRLGFGLFMVESIFLPFFAMEIFITYILETYLKDSIKVQSQGTLISAALMLCGIKPELMGVYHKIMSHVASVTNDFSVYFFSFVIWNALIS